MYNFGNGRLVIVPQVGSINPIRVGTLKGISLDIKTTVKKLIGEKQYPVDIGRGEGSITGKFQTGAIQGGLVSAILAGATVTAGRVRDITEAAAVPATPFEITVDNDTDFVDDLGVVDLGTTAVPTNTPLVRIPAADTLAAGEYKVTDGVYTFHSGATLHNVLISYSFTTASAGSTIAYPNPLMGEDIPFGLMLFNTRRSLYSGWRLHSVTITGIALAFKNDDFTMNDGEFEAFEDASTGLILTHYTEDIVPITA